MDISRSRSSIRPISRAPFPVNVIVMAMPPIVQAANTVRLSKHSADAVVSLLTLVSFHLQVCPIKVQICLRQSYFILCSTKAQTVFCSENVGTHSPTPIFLVFIFMFIDRFVSSVWKCDLWECISQGSLCHYSRALKTIVIIFHPALFFQDSRRC